MILICEPLIKSFGHEKVNSGFISAIRLAFPNEQIVLYADKTHIIAIQNILKYDNVEIDKIEYIPISFNTKNQILSFVSHFFIIKKIVERASMLNEGKIFFLSASTQILYLLNYFQKRYKNNNLKFSIVMHGFIEILGQKENINKLTNNWIINFLFFTMKNIYRPFYVFDNFFSLSRFFKFKKQDKFKYILLSEHIQLNLKKYIDTNKLNFQVVNMPTNFKFIEDKTIENTYLKIAMFGRGDYKMLIELAKKLESSTIEKPYEIRIIGKDYIDMENFINIKCSSPGIKLTREVMESQTTDIDLFLILYDNTKYTLSCSASIYESMSYLKPIIHLNNTCINYYNKTILPIGFKCNDLDDMSNKLTHLINNYKQSKSDLDLYKNNLSDLRTNLSYQRNLNTIKNIF
jgi:hypothetical protein